MSRVRLLALLDERAVDDIGQSLGLDRGQTLTAIQGLMPALAGAMATNAAKPGGLESLMTDGPGPIARFMADDHRRLESLLDRAAAGGRIEPALYEEFRAGLLRHIGLEEKILLPAVSRARGGLPLPLARQLRLDHGAIAAMLVPAPTPIGIERLRALLALHDALEEGSAGVYADCDQLLAAEAASLIRQLRDYPAVRTAKHHEGPVVERHIAQALALAGREQILPGPG
ncbi:MAG TPA: DUF937 domain-containing protein [Vicinamibacterales bacterium]|nr:DUF937 domain-containing protein [Vicinamibacterales bacterium]